MTFIVFIVKNARQHFQDIYALVASTSYHTVDFFCSSGWLTRQCQTTA